PLVLALYNLIVRKKAGFIAILGFISIFVTGIIGVFEFPSEWIAYKEASVPLIIGIMVLISLKTPFPLVKKFLYNEEILNVEKIDMILVETNNKQAFEKTLVRGTYLLAASFLVSAILNFALAKILIQSPSGTAEFNAELGKMTALSFPVIALPSTIIMLVALFYIMARLKKLTHLEVEELLSEKMHNK
ncbi:MAG TPA: VC0807 family protein, partial [Paludibacteraceae bacterium]|nr:VC0807 family protein [Paludibacteraceae bacterium]